VQIGLIPLYRPNVSKREIPSGVDTPGLARLPPGRHGLPPEFVAQNQRDRLTAGIIAVVAEYGYNDATISQIAEAAGVSRRTFYGYFSSKEQCFFATYDIIAEHLHEAAHAAAAPLQAWPQQVRAKLGAKLEVFAANPNLARFYLSAPPRAGEEISARYRLATTRSLTELTDGMPPQVRVPSPAVQSALIGGMAALIVRQVEAGEGERLAQLLPDLVELFLAPYLGRSEAARVARRAA
jgi:AcrR family transcriptional regulator